MIKIIAEYYSPTDSGIVYKTDAGFSVEHRSDGKTVGIFRYDDYQDAINMAMEIANTYRPHGNLPT